MLILCIVDNLYILCIVYSIERMETMMGVKQRIVGIHSDTYEQLKDLKYELKVDSFDEALKILLQEHSQKEGAST